MEKEDCSRHKKEIAGISDMKVLAEMIGDLHYETLSELLYHFSDKLFKDGKNDFDNGRTYLAHRLFQAQMKIHGAHKDIHQAYLISKPFMDKSTLK